MFSEVTLLPASLSLILLSSPPLWLFDQLLFFPCLVLVQHGSSSIVQCVFSSTARLTLTTTQHGETGCTKLWDIKQKQYSWTKTMFFSLSVSFTFPCLALSHMNKLNPPMSLNLTWKKKSPSCTWITLNRPHTNFIMVTMGHFDSKPLWICPVGETKQTFHLDFCRLWKH